MISATVRDPWRGPTVPSSSGSIRVAGRVGIHGTHDPSSLGTRTTEGCIRMDNKALLEIVDKAVPGTVVVIEP